MDRLIYAASPRSADMLYATGFHAPDPFVFLEARGRTTIVLNDLEIDRGRREAKVDEVLASSDLAREFGSPAPAIIAAGLLHRRKIRRVAVPSDFPLGFARALENALCGFLSGLPREEQAEALRLSYEIALGGAEPAPPRLRLIYSRE